MARELNALFAAVYHKRVLIALADPTLRRDLYRQLLDLDLYSDPVGDGEEVLAKLKARDYGVVILELTLGVEPILPLLAELPPRRRPFVFAVGDLSPYRGADLDVVQIVLRHPLNIAQTGDLVRSCVAAARSFLMCDATTEQKLDADLDV